MVWTLIYSSYLPLAAAGAAGAAGAAAASTAAGAAAGGGAVAAAAAAGGIKLLRGLSSLPSALHSSSCPPPSLFFTLCTPPSFFISFWLLVNSRIDLGFLFIPSAVFLVCRFVAVLLSSSLSTAYSLQFSYCMYHIFLFFPLPHRWLEGRRNK